MRPTSCAAIVKSILFLPSAVIDTAAMKYGCDMEEIVKQKLSEIKERYKTMQIVY